ncbi:SpoIID/LytB domain-containing protein [Geomonas sp. RF6]|uniref:SpoIID/LytB domain-containing protein n=1 Tax=Geomonas sp. RF6 TaxID=2897342 RepID=UPI001E4A56D0|nr:SpoIID/LytB domain-containing protein [Geomonas sp. RF6]UFS70537.1 SpoIID/LytB domain-containing protein [Geomonas sp. RF6]
MKALRSILIILLILVAGHSSAALRPETIRVAVVKGVETVTLDGNGVLVTGPNGEPLRLDPPIELRRSRDGVTVNGRPFSRIVATAAALVRVNGKGYRGIVEIGPGERGLLVVNELPLEEYLIGLINCEISSAWPMEAIKAQAVIARSYAVFQKAARKNAPYQLESSVMDQVYDGADQEDSRAARGVQETAGEVLTFNGRTIQAFYHANCSGHTEDSREVWGLSLPYLRGVPCKYCQEANPSRWEQTIPLKKVEGALKSAGYPVSGIREVRVGGRNESGRVQDVQITCSRGKVSVPGVAFRKAIGYGVVKSTNFDLLILGDDVMVAGAGSGHGVGLCQWGSKQRALDGFSYREILSYYYPGVQFSAAYSRPE